MNKFYEIVFTEFSNVAIECLQVFFTHLAIGLLIGILLSVLASTFFKRFYKARKVSDAGHQFLLFALFISRVASIVLPAISGGCSGLDSAYETVIRKKCDSCEIQAFPGLPEFFIMLGTLSNLNLSDKEQPEEVLNAALNEYRTKKKLNLQTILKNADGAGEVLDHRIKKAIEYSVSSFHQNLQSGLNTDNPINSIGGLFEITERKKSISFRNFSCSEYYMTYLKKFRTYIDKQEQYHGEITDSQLTKAILYFGLDGLIGPKLREEKGKAIRNAILILPITYLAAFVLVFVGTKIRTKKSPHDDTADKTNCFYRILQYLMHLGKNNF